MKIGDAAQASGFESALAKSVQALRRLATYEIEPGIQDRLRELGERKEFLTAGEHAEFISVVGFSERRTAERLEAELALKQLLHFVPELAEHA